MKFGTANNGAQRMNFNNFSDAFTFQLAPSSGQILDVKILINPVLRVMPKYLQT